MRSDFIDSRWRSLVTMMNCFFQVCYPKLGRSEFSKKVIELSWSYVKRNLNISLTWKKWRMPSSLELSPQSSSRSVCQVLVFVFYDDFINYWKMMLEINGNGLPQLKTVRGVGKGRFEELVWREKKKRTDSSFRRVCSLSEKRPPLSLSFNWIDLLCIFKYWWVKWGYIILKGFP